MSMPTESTAAARVPTRWRRAMQVPGLIDVPFARWVPISESDPRIAAFRDALMEVDPVADALAAWMQGEPAARARFDQALKHGIDSVPRAPEPLRTFFEEIESVPAWVDRDQIRLATETMSRVGTGGYTALGSVSLMSGYLASGAIKPLSMTGALTRMARRRLIETSKFVLDVASSGDLQHDAPGFSAAVRVRMIHAMVRRGLYASGKWRADEWGEPINQHDMVATNLQFSSVFAIGLMAQGYLITASERQALMHLWRYVGHLLGVRDALLPKTFREGIEVGRIINGTEAGPDDDSRALAHALMQATRELHREGLGPVLGNLRSRHELGLSRLILGRRASLALGLPDDAFRFAPLLFLPATITTEVLQRVIPGGRKLAIAIGHHITTTAIERSLAGKPTPFATPVPTPG